MVQSRRPEGARGRDLDAPRGRRDDVGRRDRHRPARSPRLDDGALRRVVSPYRHSVSASLISPAALSRRFTLTAGGLAGSAYLVTRCLVGVTVVGTASE